MFSLPIQQFLKAKNYPYFSPKAIFFDMDGVLFDSMPYHATAWVKAMNETGIPFTTHEAYMNEGRTGDSTIDGAFGRTLGREATAEEKKQIYSLKSKYFVAESKTTPMPFAFEMLEHLKSTGMQIFLVTGSGQPSLLDSLQTFFPGIFARKRMITAFDVNNGKPHPEPYLTALEKSGVHPWEVVVIENAPLGIESAKAAGLFTIALNTGPLDANVLVSAGADVVLDSMQDLLMNWNEFRINFSEN